MKICIKSLNVTLLTIQYCQTFRKSKMWIYVSTVVLCICLWKLIARLATSLKTYREIFKCLSHFPVPVDNHSFFGIAHIAKDSETYLQALEKTVDKLQPKAVAVWLTWFYPFIDVVHPDTVKTVLKASHCSIPKSHLSFFSSVAGRKFVYQ